MNQMPRSRVLAAAICLGLLSAVLIYVFLGKQAKEAYAEVPAVVATRDIVSGTIVDAGMVEIRSFPMDAIPPAVASSPEMVVGMVTVTDLKTGTPISQRQVVPKHRLSHIVPPLMRAVTVALDPIIGVGGFIKPGDHVDVLATFKVGDGSVTKTVLQNVQLLATGAQVIAEEIDPETGKPAKPQSQPNATLAVLPTDAEKLILAESRGTLRLALRPHDDTSFISSSGTNSRSVVGSVPSETPEKPKPAPASTPAAATRTEMSRPAVPEMGLPWQISSLPEPGEAIDSEPEQEVGKTIQVVRGTKMEETIVAE